MKLFRTTLLNLKKYGLYCLLIPVVLLIRSVNPLIVIRFGYLRSERIGHFALNTELYLCQRDKELPTRRIVDIFYHRKPISNQQLKIMWDRILHVSFLVAPLDRVNKKLPGGERNIIPVPTDWDQGDRLKHFATHLEFTAEENKKGQRALQSIGITDDKPFVCFHSRDSVYLNAALPAEDWTYHNHRDTHIDNFVPAMEELVRLGYRVVRMGALVEEPLGLDTENIFDYASSGDRTDFLDIYLIHKCAFFVGCTAGLFTVASVFRKPMCLTNIVPLEMLPTWGPKDLLLPKMFWLKDEGRYLTFKETIESGIGRFMEDKEYEQRGIDVIENTPDEITAAVRELEQRLKGRWVTDEQSEARQALFWSFYDGSELHGDIVGRVGGDFLKKYDQLLR